MNLDPEKKETPEHKAGRFLGFMAFYILLLSMLFFILRRIGTPILSGMYYWGYVLVILAMYLLVSTLKAVIKKPKAIADFFSGFWQGIKNFGLKASTITNFILLIPVYFIGVGVTAVFGRIFGKKFLALKPKKQLRTYWEQYELGKQEETEYFKLY